MIEHVFMAGAMFAINDKKGACPRYNTYNPQLDHIWGSLLFRLPAKILNVLRYFGLFKFVGRMGTVLFIAALPFH